jgi:serine-type D-Ala-D-Ala carboxypeptidase
MTIREDCVARWASQAGVEGGIVCVGRIGAGEHDVAAFGTVQVNGRDEQSERTHRYLLTSVTKPITATQVVALAERGCLDLDAPVAEYLPRFAVNGKERVTVANLLSHTGGLDNTTNLVEGPRCDLAPADFITIAVNAQATFPPGRQWQYCSPGYWVLGALISEVSATDYMEHMVATVAEPLCLPGLRYETGPTPPERYVEARNPAPQIPEQIRRSGYPAGAAVGSADDVVTFGLGLVDAFRGAPGSKPLGAPGVELWRREWGTGVMGGREVRWTAGWELGGPGSFQSRDTLFHVGASGTALWVDPVNGVVLSLCTSTWWLRRRYLAELANGIFSDAWSA